MADKTTKILEVVVDNNKAITSIAEMNRLIDEQTQYQHRLSEQYKSGEISQADYYKGMAQSKETVKTMKREVQELSKEVQNNIKQDTEQAGSLRALRAELSNLTKAYDSLSETERQSAEGMQLQNKIQALMGTIQGSEQKTGRFFRNVGNYANGVMEAFSRAGVAIGGLQGPLKGATMGLNAMSSTPVIAILGALISIIQKVVQNLKTSEASMNAVTTALAPLNAASRLFQVVMQKLGEGLAKVITKMTEWADKLGLIKEAMKTEQELVKSELALRQREREVLRQNADDQLAIAQLKAKAAQKDQYTAQERIGFLEEAAQREGAVAARELELARERYRILEEQSKLAENSAEENDELARSYAEMRQAEQAYFDKSRELAAQIVEAKNQIKTETAAAAAAQAAALKTELELTKGAEAARVALIRDAAAKARAEEEARHESAVAALQYRLQNEKNLTEAARKALNDQLTLEETAHKQKMAALDHEALEARLMEEAKLLALRLEAIEENSQAEFDLKMEQLAKQREIELANLELTEEMKAAIIAKYAAEEETLRETRSKATQEKELEELRLYWQNKIDEAALNNQTTLELELSARKAELDALHQMEGESDAEFKARLLDAEQAYADAKKNIDDYEVQVTQDKYDAIANITGGLISVMEAFGEENKALAKAAKVLALGEIAINTGKALAAGIAQAQTVGFPANIAAIATTVTTILANIAAAISTVKSAKFATGGLVIGPGTGTSDSIPARLSNGESVMNARSTQMFGPLLSTLNQAGGGVAFNPAAGSREGFEFLAAAVESGMKNANIRVAVDQISKVQDEVARIKTVSTI